MHLLALALSLLACDTLALITHTHPIVLLCEHTL